MLIKKVAIMYYRIYSTIALCELQSFPSLAIAFSLWVRGDLVIINFVEAITVEDEELFN
jgi:hypothetical protein